MVHIVSGTSTKYQKRIVKRIPSASFQSVGVGAQYRHRCQYIFQRIKRDVKISQIIWHKKTANALFVKQYGTSRSDYSYLHSPPTYPWQLIFQTSYSVHVAASTRLLDCRVMQTCMLFYSESLPDQGAPLISGCPLDEHVMYLRINLENIHLTKRHFHFVVSNSPQMFPSSRECITVFFYKQENLKSIPFLQ